MYTQCPECGTVFRLSADTLRVAGGDVRCGICSTVFNALDALSDSPSSHLAQAPPPEDTFTVEEVTGTEIIELGAQGERVPRTEIGPQDSTWPADDTGHTEVRSARSGVRPDGSAGYPDDADGPDAIEVTIADDEVAAMLEASGTWERLRIDPRPSEAAMAAAAEAEQPMVTGEHPSLAEAMAESMAASATAPDGGRESILALVAANAEQITLESPRDPETGTAAVAALAAPPAPAPAAAATDAAPATVELTAPPPTTAPADGGPDLDLGQDVDLAWEDDLDEAAAALREHEISELAEAIGTGRFKVLPDTAASTTRGGDAADAVVREIDLDATDEFPIIVLDERDEPLEGIDVTAALDAAGGSDGHDTATATAAEAVETPSPQAPATAATDAAVEAPPARLQIHIPPELRYPPEAPADSAIGPPAEDRAALEFSELVAAADREGGRRWPWVAAAGVLALLLAAQVIHLNRAKIVADPTFGTMLARAYALLGLDLEAPVDLAAFELRQWGASSDAVARNRLRFRASIVNHASHPQPYPLLRLSVQDRFGNLVGERDALPREYLRGAAPAATTMLPGQRVDAELVVVDPGDSAVGFELQLCVPEGAGVRCAKDGGGT